MNLFTSNKTQTSMIFLDPPFFASGNIAPLKKEERQLCEELVSVSECLNALKEFKKAKSPMVSLRSFINFSGPNWALRWFPVLIMPSDQERSLSAKDEGLLNIR